MANASANTIELAQTGKRDELRELELKYQAKWQEERLFEVEPPSQEELKGLSPAEIREQFPKWFGNFPFPYTNGSLHLGHAFTISKIEFAAGYHRMVGKRVLFPHGFHCTGMPIKVRRVVCFAEEVRRIHCGGRRRRTKSNARSRCLAKTLNGSSPRATPTLLRPHWHPMDLQNIDRKSTRLNSSHSGESRMPSSA